jgi:hypothetical protein
MPAAGGGSYTPALQVVAAQRASLQAAVLAVLGSAQDL